MGNVQKYGKSAKKPSSFQLVIAFDMNDVLLA